MQASATGTQTLTLSRERIDQLADDIAVCAARIDAANHELLCLIREFDEARGWARQGARSCAHWLSWRIGCGLNAAGEKVRVARALGGLPRIEAALRAGSLSYCKVRAMTRVATQDNEELLLDYARSCSGARLEKVCRGLRQVERRIGRAAPERSVRRRTTAEGMVRIELELHPDEAELVWQALEETKRQLRGEAAAEGDLSAERSGGAPTLADAAVAMAEQRLASEPADARAGGVRRTLFVHLRAEQLEAGGWRAELHDGTLLSGESLLRVACDSSLVAVKTDHRGNALDLGRKRRAPSPALMRALRLRDRRCAWPGCECEAFLEGHHLRHWAQGGETNLDNTTLLCWVHHGLVHEGGFRVERGADGELLFFDPEGRRIVASPKPPALEGDALPMLATAQLERGIVIDSRTSLPDWDGRPQDVAGAVSALVRRGERASADAPAPA